MHLLLAVQSYAFSKDFWISCKTDFWITFKLLICSFDQSTCLQKRFVRLKTDPEKRRLNAVVISNTNSFKIGNVHKGCPTIMGNFGHTYLPMSDVFYTMPITLVRFLLRYLPTPKSDVLYERSQRLKLDVCSNRFKISTKSILQSL